MFRLLPYTLLYLVVVALQISVFDRLLISTAVAPLIYTAFIALLPMQTSQFKMLMWGLFIGASFDLFMGTPGLNTIATLFVSYTRHRMLTYTIGQDLINLGGIPTPLRVSARRFIPYVALLVCTHSTIFFVLEFLNFHAIWFLLCRIIFSSAITLLFVWLIAGRFEQILMRKF